MTTFSISLADLPLGTYFITATVVDGELVTYINGERQ